ncbi:DUF3093 domain-containing protein [Streptomyces cyaneofuscatus]|uniref:DUF3093 domain-containing protein n=1 Tax=Streptomyces cyaneofuscatus TaxID=66883 RepID=UPI0037FD086A
MAADNALAHDERLTVPRTWWAIVFAFGLAMALVFFPYGAAAALVAFAIGGGLASSFAMSQGAMRIRVTPKLLVIGDARLPLNALGEPQALAGDEARAWRTYKADMRAFLVMRSYISTAVRVEILDPDDPTPYLYVSTRAPEQLAAAIRDAARSGEARGHDQRS